MNLTLTHYSLLLLNKPTNHLNITNKKKLTQTLQHPQNFYNIHFFNPIPHIPLIKIIHNTQTSKTTINKIIT
ncbi:hypothetical protein DF186_14600 [Enterococcus hirae]|nr:hypothetical protein DF186_14600 [Enterococcus hirae]